MMEKIWGLVGTHYWLQNNDATLLRYLSNRHAFLDSDLDKIWSLMNLSHLYFQKSLQNLIIQLNRQQFIASIIILAVMVCFYSSSDSYGLGQNAHMFHFFTFFCNGMIIVIYSMLAIDIQDLALSWNNKELTTKKSAVWFKPIS